VRFKEDIQSRLYTQHLGSWGAKKNWEQNRPSLFCWVVLKYPSYIYFWSKGVFLFQKWDIPGIACIFAHPKIWFSGQLRWSFGQSRSGYLCVAFHSIAVSGSLNRWDRWYIIPQLAVYTTYILPIGWLYTTYHLLREPGNSIDPLFRSAASSKMSTALNPKSWKMFHSFPGKYQIDCHQN